MSTFFRIASFGLLILNLASPADAAADPLRVFIRAGVKTHGPGQHDHPRFLGDYTKILQERGARVEGAMEFPSAAQLEATDVLVIFAADGMKIVGDQRTSFESFLKRGGGVVVIHDGVVSGDQHEWAKKVQGGAWRWDGTNKTKWLESKVGVYFVDPLHPIVKGISNFDWTDEIYYDLDMAPDARVLATSFHSVFIIAPQIWTYEKTWEGGNSPYRCFVSIPGHEYASFQTSHYRSLLLRGIAWAGKRENVDELCRPEEIAVDALRYPEGGPVNPSKASATFNVHPEFDVSLVAAEPLVEKVISLDWDPQGRLWVAETPEYPGGRTVNKNDKMVALWNVTNPEAVAAGNKDNRPARDRISWLVDDDGDGRMDRKQIFADADHGVAGGLELVTSLVPFKDGVIVAQAPDILWIRDTNGDGTADKVETLYTGFGTMDTHAVINNFRWGLDGWVYCAVGYSAGQPRSPMSGKDFGRITAGILRFRPDGSALEQVASGACNTWGFDFSPDGELFYTTATCGEHFLHLVMPEKFLARGNVGGVRSSFVAPDHQKIFPAVHHTRPAYVQIDWVGFFTAAAGSCIYNGGAWPDRWTGSHFCSETTMSLVHQEFLRPTNSTYVASREAGREEAEFIAGSDLWFRPIHTRVGPDGALYVVDFYNQAAIHNDTRGPAHGARNAATRPDRDHHFGRIWRVQHKHAKAIDRPKLADRNTSTLVAALQSDNGWTRDTAARLLREMEDSAAVQPLTDAAKNSTGKPFTRIAALYTLDALGKLDTDSLLAFARDPEPIVRKNALRLAADRSLSARNLDRETAERIINDSNARARLNGLLAASQMRLTPESAQVLVNAWPQLADKHQQSALVAVAGTDPVTFLNAAFNSPNSAQLVDLTGHVTRFLANRQEGEAISQLVIAIAKQPASTDALKQAVLETLGTTLKPDVTPAWNEALTQAFRSLLTSNRPGLPGAALPLASRWDKQGTLSANLMPVIRSLRDGLQDASLPDTQRGQIAANLLGVRALDPEVVPAVASLLGPSSTSPLQRRVVDALGATGDVMAGNALLEALPRLDTDMREAAFGQLVKRADWAAATVQALADRKFDAGLLGPANLYRLRTHADKQVAEKANRVIDDLKGPEQKQKDALLARFTPEVEKSGNLENGHKVYTANCAPCHRFKDEGAEFAPTLTGMGAHGAADLLIHILDPNRLVEPNYVAISVETKDDQTFDGIVLRENQAAVVVRNQTGEFEIRKDNIKNRVSTGRSLMPEGFEQLGADGLRDLLNYICAEDQRFRILDLTPVFTASTSEGIYNSKESRDESLKFRKFGTIKVGDVPFDIVSPRKSTTGNNIIVLKGGAGISRSYPQKLEIPVGLPVTKLYFLGGIGGWAYPFDGEKNKNLDAAKVTLRFAGGRTEEMVFKNGVEIADYIGKYDVPGSTAVPNLDELLLNGRQLRWFSRPVMNRERLESLTLESFNNAVAPTFVAITAEIPTTRAVKSEAATKPAAGVVPSAAPSSPLAKAANPAPASANSEDTSGSIDKSTFRWDRGLRTLMVGGGSSHDFGRWFNLADAATLREKGRVAVNYTEVTRGLDLVLPSADLLYLSNNRPFANDAARAAVFAHANTGKGLIIVHPALWYNWEKDWPEYNRVLCGGGSRGHDRYGEFEVTVTEPTHPLVQGLPTQFSLSDELYWFQPDASGTPIKVLATAYSKQKKQVYPMIFVVEHPTSRIAAITLGHDGSAHSHPAYQRLLLNAVTWASRKGGSGNSN